MLESILGSLVATSLILLTKIAIQVCAYFFITLIALSMYYATWFLHCSGITSAYLLLFGLVLMPPLYFYLFI
ncbi:MULTISPECIES: hypothetical protein [Helicobacter]|uniref:hypothetical protein n=1 Tax=Helicobacter TaxID=209 RepID=UPI0025A552AA|nr:MULTISPECIES: hypothetical protein [Helicobacter]